MRAYSAALVATWLAACGPREAAELCEPILPDDPYGYSDDDAPLPAHFVRSTVGTVLFSDPTPADNRISNAGAALGRVLFHDVRLSVNDRVACASCHQQSFGFADTLRASRGVSGRPLPRRTMALANARFSASGRFYWDERAPTLEELILVPIQSPDEMGSDLEELERELAAEPFYRGMFAAAFGSPEVTADRIARAIAQFVRSLVSAQSRFDAVFATGGAPDDSMLTDLEREGFELFDASGCAGCHRTIAFFADQASNTGLDVAPGRFKPPSLRNLAVRPPYMHDGRFATLEDVIEFYDRGVQPNPDLDPRMRAADGSPRRLGLTPRQSAALVAFLESLTDSAFLRADRFSDPFPCSAEVAPR